MTTSNDDQPAPVVDDRELVADLDRRFGERMRARREAMGLPQNVLAMRLHALHDIRWHQTTVGKVESGERPIRLQEAVAVALALGVPLAELTTEGEHSRRTALRSRAASSLYELAQVRDHISKRMNQIEEDMKAYGEHPETS